MNVQVVAGFLERDKDGTWYYIHIPREIRGAYKQLEKHGIIPIRATIGKSTWNGTLLPWADGSAQLSVDKTIRVKEMLEEGDPLTLTLAPR